MLTTNLWSSFIYSPGFNCNVNIDTQMITKQNITF